MSLPEKKSGTGLALQLVIVTAVLGIGALILYVVGAFNSRPEGYRSITYRVEGTASTAVVTYTQPDGSKTELIEIAVPWRKTMNFPKGMIVVLTVGNPTQTGDLRCKLLLDGKVWKEQFAKSPKDKVSCGGIIP
ncbi:MAG: MmpS family protein [Anaerolineales bacterium]|nr:MmpS family protein [Anaerolineales bacterium]